MIASLYILHFNLVPYILFLDLGRFCYNFFTDSFNAKCRRIDFILISFNFKIIQHAIDLAQPTLFDLLLAKEVHSRM